MNRCGLRRAQSLVWLLLGAAPGCGLLDTPGAGNGGSSGGAVGFGKPTLEVTVAGMHFGPDAPDPGSSVSLVDTRDAQGRIVQSTFSIGAAVAATSGRATCAFLAVRESPEGVAPIGAQSFQIAADANGMTPDGTVSPGGTESVVVPQADLICSGTGCNAGTLVLSALDASHAEGYFQGTYADTAGRGLAGIVCAFYLPMGNYQP